MNCQLDIVDVLTTSKYTGNQLAVVSECLDLTTDEMISIAGEMNYSETTFVPTLNPPDDQFPVRIFTPRMELPFAGHPVLGTAHVIRHYLPETDSDEVTLDLPSGPVPVTVESDGGEDRYWMRQQAPEFTAKIDHETIATVLGLELDDLNIQFPVSEVSTGLPVLIVPLETLGAIQRADPDWNAYERHLGDLKSESILVFGPETYHEGNDLNVRVFSQRIAQNEDPATGSGNGCLAGYLTAERYFDMQAVSARVEQGYEINRPSLIHIRSNTAADANICVGGTVVTVARGELF